MRKLATAAAVSLALASGGAKALILGEIEMRSALNQPIDAEIGLSSATPADLEGMLVKLASPEAFARAGIERSRVLTDLKFEVTTGANGQPVILISSKKPVLEPFLNFLVDVDWRGGRLVREYTVLLDPPVFMTPSASVRDSSADTPAVVPLAEEESILTPLPIDRTAVDSTAESFDESSVAVLGEAVEIGDGQVSSVDVDLGALDTELGEVVELGGLEETGDGVGNTIGSEAGAAPVPGTEIDSQLVTLSDPDVVAPADVQANNSHLNADTAWEVQVMGDTEEVGDDVGAPIVPLEEVTLLSEDVGAEIDLGAIASAGSVDSSGASGTAGNNRTSASAGSELVVQKNDTLWQIAEANKVQGVSTQQMMLALLEANQQAFINGNINLVKAGAVLRIPEAVAMTSITQTQALAEVKTHERLWREYRDNLRGVQSSSTMVASVADSTAETAETATADAGSDSGDTGSDAATATSAAAQQILDQARDEIRQLEAQAQNGGELKILADNSPTSTVASATADETATPDTDKLGSINRKLQLAREELAAARLESEELASQSTELDSVTSNMDQLVTMQQDKLAKLQAQLAEAQKAEQLAGEQALAQTDSETLADAARTVQANAEDTAAGLAPQVANTAAAADPDAEPIELASLDAPGANSATQDNASVEAAAAAAGAEPAVATQQAAQAGPWYQDLLNSKGAMIGGAGALTLAGLFLLLRRRKQPEDGDLLDEVEFIDDETDMNAAGVVAVADEADPADLAADMTGENVSLDEAMEDMSSATSAEDALDIDSGLGGADLADDTDSSDDTISEAEVYLAYGLHGQAEDLLIKAVEREPENAEYRIKLLQTYHAQGNQAAFEEAAAVYHQDFGGAASPEWETIRALGEEINPSNELFLGDTGEIESVGKGDFDGPKLDSDDFLSENTDTAESVSQIREFSSDETPAADLDATLDAGKLDINESDLLDQSLDPGLAFDETDLEATGDFSQMTQELNQEQAANEASANPPASDDGIIEFDAPELTSLDKTTAVESAEDDSVAQDLSMDLDQLSGDMELDTTEILEGGLDLSQDLEMPDLTSAADLTGDASSALGDVDEMDTMMDLAKAYIDMGDNDSASSALGEIVKSGSPEQKSEAENLLRKIS